VRAFQGAACDREVAVGLEAIGGCHVEGAVRVVIRCGNAPELAILRCRRS
jgi:hypothetical protein